MVYTAQTATDAIAAFDLDNLTSSQIESELKSIISQLSVEQKAEFNVDPNAKTVLYSKYDVSNLIDDSNVRLIDKTEAYDFLSKVDKNEALIDALTKVYGETPNFKDYNSPAGQFIGGIDGEPRTPGAWDTISRNFVKAGSGELITLIGNDASVSRTFMGTEWNAVLETPAYDTINFSERNTYLSQFSGLDNTEQLSRFKTFTSNMMEIAAMDPINVGAMNEKISNVFPDMTQRVNAIGMLEHFGVDTDTVKLQLNMVLENIDVSDSANKSVVTNIVQKLNPDLNPTKLAQDIETLKARGANLETINLVRETYKSDLTVMRDNDQQNYKAALEAGDTDGMAKYAKSLNRLGGAFAVLGFGIMLDDAQAAYNEGNIGKMQEIIGKYVSGGAGGWLGAAGGVALATAIASGPVGWVALAAVGLTGGVIGSYGGEKIGDQIMNTVGLGEPQVTTTTPAATETQNTGLFLGVEGSTDIGIVTQAPTSETTYSYGNGASYKEVMYDDSSRNYAKITIPTNDGGREEITLFHSPEEMFNAVSLTVKYDKTGNMEYYENKSLLKNGGTKSIAYSPDGKAVIIGTRIQKEINGDLVDVTFGADGRPAQVNTINGKPVEDAAGVLKDLDEAGLTSDNMADGNIPNSIGAIIDANDPTAQSAFKNFINGFSHNEIVQGIANYGPSLIDALSLIKAIQTGEPLPIVTSGLRLANDIDKWDKTVDLPYLNGAASVAGGVLSIMSLDAALKRGDTLGVIASTANAVNFGAIAYASFTNTLNATSGLSFEIGQQLLGTGLDHMGANALGLTNGALPYLNLALAIQSGDEVGIAVAAISLIPGMQWVGIAYGVYSMIDSLFGGDEIPDPWGTGRFVWDGTAVTYQSAGETGGNEAVSGMMSSILSAMNSMIDMERTANPDFPLGLIPNRMPSVAYDMSGYRYTDIDPLTGEELHPSLRFDTSGKPYNATQGLAESFISLGEAIIRSALSRGAIAPMWEVYTAQMQTLVGDPKAGLTEEARAGRDGQLAGEVTGDTQVFRPIVLDLNGDGIHVIDKSVSMVNFDVDNSGFLKQSAWIDNNDAFLTLDRNFNGVVDSGKEMFSNSTVSLDRRGLAGMAYVNNLIEIRRVG